MARLALQLPVFISSPSDVQNERDEVERVVVRLAGEAARHDLALSVYRFEKDAIPSFGRPVDQSNVDLRASELVIAILGQGVGSPARVGSSETGTLEELRIAEALVRMGQADDLFLYYRATDSNTPVPSIAPTMRPIIESRQQTVWPYGDAKQLGILVERHVRRWLEDWYGIPEICRHAFERSELAVERAVKTGESRLDAVIRKFELDSDELVPGPLGDLAVKMYQRHGQVAATLRLPEDYSGRSPLVQNVPGQGSRFVHHELFFLACASGLITAIARRDTSAVEHKPYVNDVHQYLAALVARSPDRSEIIGGLQTWLRRRKGIDAVRPVTRNFAAYVLGMVGADEAADQLAESLEGDDDAEVRFYCVTSLGKLRSRRHLSLLRNTYKASRHTVEQEMIAKAICRIIGIARFEL